METIKTMDYAEGGPLILESSLWNTVIEDDEIKDEEAYEKERVRAKKRGRSLSYQKKHFMDHRLITLIRNLKKKYDLSQVFDFNIFICGYANEEETEIDTMHPFCCRHYHEKTSKSFYFDGTSVFPWWYFEVEDYVFGVSKHDTNTISLVYLYVKLTDISRNPNRIIEDNITLSK